ncbi:MAG: DUF3347 domain-containing protein [Myxococcota bacterium]
MIRTSHVAATVAFTLAVITSPLAQATGGTDTFDEGMQPIVARYLVIQDALASDSTTGVTAAATDIATLAGKLDAKSVTGEHAEHYKDVPAKLGVAAAMLAKAKTLDEARAAFKGVSMPMAMWAGMAKPDKIDVVYCDMAKGSWLQARGPVRNPYYGKSMLSCGEVVGAAGHACTGDCPHKSEGGHDCPHAKR